MCAYFCKYCFPISTVKPPEPELLSKKHVHVGCSSVFLPGKSRKIGGKQREKPRTSRGVLETRRHARFQGIWEGYLEDSWRIFGGNLQEIRRTIGGYQKATTQYLKSLFFISLILQFPCTRKLKNNLGKTFKTFVNEWPYWVDYFAFKNRVLTGLRGIVNGLWRFVPETSSRKLIESIRKNIETLRNPPEAPSRHL